MVSQKVPRPLCTVGWQGGLVDGRFPIWQGNGKEEIQGALGGLGSCVDSSSSTG